MTERRITIDEQLDHDIDVEARVSEIPGEMAVHGAFFNRLLDAMGRRRDSVIPELSVQPRKGRYLAFKAYPQRDYGRLIAAAARSKYGTVPLAEGMRRLARDDFGVFAESTFGKIILTAVGDARGALHKTPTAYEKLAPGFDVFTATDLDERTVRFDFAPQRGFWEYQLGQFEGVVMKWYPTPEIVMRELPEEHVQYDIRWKD